jgi:hypothetical protein
VRFELALNICGHRIYEVITATLGPLPLDQLPKSKPVTPSSVMPRTLPDRHLADQPREAAGSAMPGGQPQNAGPSGIGQDVVRTPAGAGGGRKLHPRGLTGRVGPVLSGRASPEMRPGSHHHDWAATPRAAPQSLSKTPERSGKVAPCYENAVLRKAGVTKMQAMFRLRGSDHEPDCRSWANRPATGAADTPGDLPTTSTAKATSPRKPTNQLDCRPSGPVRSGTLPTCP